MSSGLAAGEGRSPELAERLASLPEQPGVYRLLDAERQVLYVGKAGSLRRRVSSYFNRSVSSPRIQAMVAQVRDLQVTVTRTEAEALLLENNLIKSLRPRYNVLLRDDKSYPYIYLSSHQRFPRLGFYRGSCTGPGRYFGPYPSAGAVRETLSELQKVFPVRQCRDSFFRNRLRPCLQYQIQRCTAPCVGYVDEARYAQDVRHVEMFLTGRSSEVLEELGRRMEAAAAALEFERAALLRDRIASLQRIQSRQYVAGARGDVDVVACRQETDIACVQLVVIRGGRNLGDQSFFPRSPEGLEPAELLSGFLARHYLDRATPREIIVSHDVPDRRVLEEALSRQSGRQVRISPRVRGDRQRWLEQADANAAQALQAKVASRLTLERRFEALQEELELQAMPERIECFDISHIRGEATVASCVVFNREGPVKADYRRFNIKGITPGDDYAAMQQALERRYIRLKRGEGRLPDLLLIDGGPGQLARAEQVLQELQVEEVALVGISKGPRRRAGEETLLVSGRAGELHLAPDSPGFHLLQQIRDEAHRFAITGHRQRRGRKRTTSVLEEIPGLGPKRRQALLRHFGGLQGVTRAGLDDLRQVPGISRELAERIHVSLHG